NELTKQVRTFSTDSSGIFFFPDLVPGSYELQIGMPGFKTIIQRGIPLASLERVDVHELKLEVGAVGTSIEVQADSVHVATDSSDRGIAVNTRQIEDTPSRGRNYLDIMRSLPGTQATNSNDTRGIINQAAPAINGGQQG